MEDTANVEEQIRDVEDYIPPDELKKGDVVEGSTKDFPLKVSEMIGNDKTLIYDTLTGEASVALKYMLPSLLREKRPDGSPIWTTQKPKLKVKMGTIKCMLHPDDPNRKKWDKMGFPVCYKHNLANQHALRQHMRHRHKIEWEAIEQERLDEEKKKDRELQESLIKGVKQATKKR